ncbi:MAG: amidohydrolase family protein [Woeseiaceae bacterium]
MKKHHLLIICLGFLASGCSASPAPASRTAHSVDLIVLGDHVLTMTDSTVALNQAVVIDDGIIIAIGDTESMLNQYTADEQIDGKDRIVLPGLVNGHTHAAMTLMRGIADDLELMTWLNEYIFPAEVELVDPEFIRVGTELACWEMIRGGTTTFIDMYFFPETVASTVESCGLRAVVVPSVIEQESPDAKTFEQSLEQALAFAANWKDRHPRIIPALGAHSVYTVGEAALKKIVAAAHGADLPISIHVAESQFEMTVTNDQYQKSPIQLLDDLGFLDDTLIAAHVIYGSDEDWQRMARDGVGAIHNPTSNLKLASGISPIVTMREAGVTVGLGTDGAASNNDLDMWEEIRLAAFVAKGFGQDPTFLPAHEALDMATRSGAKAVGLGKTVGTLEIGKKADLIQVSTHDLSFAPMYDPISHLVYVADEHDVVTTVVEGAVLMRDKQILTIDEDQLRRDVAKIREKIAALVNR